MNHKKSSSVKTFFVAFLGAVLACALVLGVQGVMVNKDGQSATSGSNTTINVSGEDATLAKAVAQKATPSVVNIDVYTETRSQTGWGVSSSSSTSQLKESSLGSGVILSADGYLLTNYHVIEDADKLMVTANGDQYEAKVVGTDPSSDLAVLKIDASGLTPIEIGDSSKLTAGDWVMAIGSPYGLEQSVSTGIVSNPSRSSSSLYSKDSSAIYANMIQTDAAINPGNSGGALVDNQGKLIGINTLIASASGASSGVGFAIPIDYAMGIAQQIMNGETPSHAQLGVSLISVDQSVASRYDLPVDHGAYISQVVSGSGAASSGLEVGDIITKVDGKDVSSGSDVIMAVRSHNVGDTVALTYNRNGKESTCEVILGKDA